MENCIKLELLYNKAKKDLNGLLYGDKHTQKNLLNILDKLSFGKSFQIFDRETFLLEEVSKIFRHYEELLKKYFEDDKSIFEWLFKCYTIVMKLFTELCLVFSTNKDKKTHIYDILQVLKESNTMLKFMIPLEQKEISTLNNLVGEQLYYFTHLEYKDFKGKDFEYVIEYYNLSLEKQFHGFELSSLSEFGNKEFVDEQSEYMIFMNNASFLLLKMVSILKSEYKDSNFFDNGKFKNILEFYKKISKLNKNIEFDTLKSFENSLIQEFLKSNEYLNKNKDYDMLDEKLKLLRINTDEYKQLIDIILNSKY